MFNNFTEKWDLRFLELARTISTWSKDPSTQCGAVIVRPNKSIVSVGFNGLPNTIISGHEPEILENRADKIGSIVHAEENALIFSKGNLKNSCIYTYPLMTCSKCCSLLLQSGITRFVAPKLSPQSDKYERWKDSFALSHKLIKLSDVEFVEYEFES